MKEGACHREQIELCYNILGYNLNVLFSEYRRPLIISPDEVKIQFFYRKMIGQSQRNYNYHILY